MKLSVIIILAACLQVSARGYSQSFKLDLKDVSLDRVFREIHKQGKFDYLFNGDVKSRVGNISVTADGDDINTVLKKVFSAYPFVTYTIDNNLITVHLRSGVANNAAAAVQLPIDVTGKLVNEKGEPVVATVTVKGTKNAVSTDANGFFVLKDVREDATLVITGVGIETREIEVEGRADLATISTVTRITAEQEVLISTGIHKPKANEITGAINVVGGELLTRTTYTDVISRMRGLVPGLLTIGLDNEEFPNANNLVLRGYSSILASKQPLIVVDNFPMEIDITSINPNDVESITVLKDAAAASIWGAKSGNGVIVITTKKGRYNDRPKVSLTSNITIVEKPDLFYTTTLNSSDYIDLETFLFSQGRYDADISSPSMPPLSPAVEILLRRRNGQISAADSAAQLNALRGLDVRNDLLKFYFDRPVRQQYAVNVTGGSNNHKYYLSAGYDYNVNSITDFKRISINASNNFSFLDNKLEVATSIWCSQTKTKSYDPPYAFRYPYGQLIDAQGNPARIDVIRRDYADTAGGGRLLDWTYRPLEERDYIDNSSTGLNYRINASVKYKIIKGLDAELQYLYERGERSSRNYHSLNSFFARDYINQFSSINWSSGTVTRAVPLGGIMDQKTLDIITHNFRGQLNYTAEFGSDHEVSALAGAEVRNSVSSGNSYRYYGYDDEKVGSIPVDFVNSYPNYITGNPAPITSNQGGFIGLNDRYVSAFFNGAYIFRGRYTVSASFRRDGSNIFGTTTNNKWTPLWSTGVSWDVTKEKFFDVSWLPRLKLRATYGYQGNVEKSVAALLTIQYNGTPNRWNLPWASINNPPNRNLRWEKIRQMNFGVDYSLFNDRISGSIEYYRKKGTDLIGEESLPPSSGIVLYKGNTADIKGGGVDFMIRTRNTLGPVKWATTFIFSYARDEVTNYKSNLTHIGGYVAGGINPIVGRPVSALYSYRWAGLDPVNGDPQGYLNGQISKDYTELTTSSNLADMVYNGPSLPPYFGSVLNTVEWKGFSLSALITYKFGFYFRRTSLNYSNLFAGNPGHEEYTRRWQKPGDEQITNVPSLIYPVDPNRDVFYTNSEILIEKGDHIRLQDIRLGYDINKAFVKKLPFENVRLFVNISNVGIIWRANNSNIDPEFYFSTDYIRGLPGKTISFGTKIDF